MKNLFITSILLIFFQLSAQTPAKLTGAIIGTKECVDYDNGNVMTTTKNTAANLFDGNFATYFATYQRDGGWAGLDLGTPHIITTVKYCPRGGQPNRVQLGVFEGANSPDFGDAIPLLVIPTGAPENQLTSQNINSSKGYRYVRYVGRRDVRCNIAELEFWGYPAAGDHSHVGQVTNLPTFSIHIVNNGVVTSKTNYLKGIISVIDGNYFHTDSLEIRGRGNASWDMTKNGLKKPYRVKLFNKTKLLNNPASERSWTLINNWGDKTLFRNLIAFDISRRFEMPFTSIGRLVDVVLNGEYQGTYQLSDQIEVATGRVETDKMKVTDVSLPNLSGGYLVEIDAYAYSETSWFESSRRVPVTVKYPKNDEIVPAQFNYIRNHFNLMENSLFSAGYTHPSTGYRKYIDVPTFVRHFLIGELSGNTDTYWSVYMTKKRNDDKFYFGPAWDFDLGFENDNRTYPIKNITEWLCLSDKSSAANGMKDFVRRWLSDPEMVNEIKNVWSYYRKNGIITPNTMTAVVDSLAAEANVSQDLNFKCWNILNEYTHQMWGRGDYNANVKIVRDYLTERIAWIDKKVGYDPANNDNPGFDDIIVTRENNDLIIKNLKNKTKIFIFDISGRLFAEAMSGNEYRKTLSGGVYIIRLKMQNGENKVYKFVI